MRWIPKQANAAKAQVLAATLRDLKLGVPATALPVIADLLVRRGIQEPDAAARFLKPELSQLHEAKREVRYKPSFFTSSL